ncbi:MAG: imidazole glycerol phosphate synthase subunit HisH [Candidatus Omnitrophota bacterium]
MIVVVDYKMGNLRSVSKALEAVGAKVIVTSSPKIIKKATKLVFPGVGAFGDAMQELEKLNLIDTLKEEIFKKPFLGICLGLELLFEESDEAKGMNGLGIFKGKIKLFPVKVKIPHMGWNQIQIKKKCPIFKNIPDDAFMYFCHSYYVPKSDKSIIASETNYGLNFVSAVNKDNIFAVQFHPEKSQKMGLKLLENFIKL